MYLLLFVPYIRFSKTESRSRFRIMWEEIIAACFESRVFEITATIHVTFLPEGCSVTVKMHLDSNRTLTLLHNKSLTFQTLIVKHY